MERENRKGKIERKRKRNTIPNWAANLNSAHPRDNTARPITLHGRAPTPWAHWPASPSRASHLRAGHPRQTVPRARAFIRSPPGGTQSSVPSPLPYRDLVTEIAASNAGGRCDLAGILGWLRTRGV
jgi:hypothetical protein